MGYYLEEFWSLLRNGASLEPGEKQGREEGRKQAGWRLHTHTQGEAIQERSQHRTRNRRRDMRFLELLKLLSPGRPGKLVTQRHA